MEEDFKISLLSICELFENHSVQYMIIGGTAVAYYGYYRQSTNISGDVCEKPDIDIWYNPSYENYFNIIKVIESLGKDVSKYREDKNPDPRKSFFKMELADFTLDLLPEIRSKIQYSEASSRREIATVNGINIYFISLNDLMEDKKTSARKKDLEDIDELNKFEEDR
jgi:predicted nucleotidyltransferase